jgi:hypothetical protein
LRIGALWMFLVPVSAQKIESSTLVFPCPLRPLMVTISPFGVISTARSFLMFSAVSLTIFIVPPSHARQAATRDPQRCDERDEHEADERELLQSDLAVCALVVGHAAASSALAAASAS